MPAYPEQNISVYPADAFCVVAGANLGDGLSGAEDLVLDDLYRLRDDAHRRRLALEPLGDTTFRVARGSDAGKPGNLVHLDCAITLMSPDGQSVEALILVEVDDDWLIEGVHVLPLARIEPKTDYALVGCDKAAARRRFAQVACVSFTAGTHIAMATGKQVPIEDIRAGDRVLTRDAGPQEVRWIGHSTVRAVGEFAPVVIERGVLNNNRDLVVSPEHRLFVYQRRDALGAGSPEILVKARHLVNGGSVYVREGGFVDYYQILFDHHHIIYAEGIAAESMLVDPRTRPVLPEELLTRVGTLLSDKGGNHGVEVQEALLNRPDAIDLLRRASTG